MIKKNLIKNSLPIKTNPAHYREEAYILKKKTYLPLTALMISSVSRE